MENERKNEDGLLHISLMGGQARAFLIHSTTLCETARKTHNLSRVATAALGRVLTATAMMSEQLKDERQSLTCIVKGDGPIGKILTVGHSDGSVKGYVDNPDVDLPRNGKKLPVGDAVGKEGTLAVIKDLNMKQPYVGQVNLVSGEIAEDFAMYFTASEQTPSLVSLGVLTDDHVVAAGGLIVQMMPGASEAAIQSVEMSTGMFENISQTMLDYGLQGSVGQLLMHLEPEILSEITPRYHCDCSRERVERALISLGSEEISDIIAEQGGCEVECQFCEKKQAFDKQELMDLVAQLEEK